MLYHSLVSIFEAQWFCGPICVEFACAPCACVGVNVSVNGCLSLYLNAMMDCRPIQGCTPPPAQRQLGLAAAAM